jgi:crotonobetainyl-CoA:carnitine CoA-transferase CaiB-like acyl-CoA transferase
MVNERYRTNVLRVKNRPALNQLLGETIAFLPLNTLVSELQAANIPYGIIKDMQEVFETPEVQGLLLQSDDRIGVRTYVGTPFRDGASHFLPPPHLGEHSQEILIQSLAMPAQEIKSLVKAGIII